MNMIGKISVKTVGANGEIAKGKAHGEKFPLFAVYGTAREIIVKKNADGDLLNALKGGFQAINSQSGEVFDSGVLYLPGGMQEILEDAMATNDPSVFNAVKFAVEVYAIAATNKVGYTYGARYLNEPTGADPMAEMRALALAKMTQTDATKALAAPVEEAKEAPAKAPKEKAPAPAE